MLNLPSRHSRDIKHAAFRKRKDLTGFLALGFLVVLAGTWLVWTFLKPLLLNSTSETKPASSFSPSVIYWEVEIQTWAEAWSLDPILIATVMQIESCGNPKVNSPAGAQGLFQVMPYHFQSGENMLDPQTNAARGLAYLSRSFTLAEGDIALTLAGYNGGHGQIALDSTLWPDETQRYVLWGTGIYRDAQTGDPDIPTLTAWLHAGGQQLCELAEIQLGIQSD